MRGFGRLVFAAAVVALVGAPTATAHTLTVARAKAAITRVLARGSEEGEPVASVTITQCWRRTRHEVRCAYALRTTGGTRCAGSAAARYRTHASRTVAVRRIAARCVVEN